MVQMEVLVVVQMVMGYLFLVQISSGWRGHELEVELEWGIGGKMARSQRRCYSKMGMKVLRKVVKWVH